MQYEYDTGYGILRYFDCSSQVSDGGSLPVLFIHGLGCCGSIDYFEIAQSKILAENRCIVVDLLGSGLSDKPIDFNYNLLNQAKILQGLIHHLGLKKLAIYGHSMGGTIAILLAELITNKIENLILSEANLDNGGGEFSRKIANSSLNDFCQHGFDNLIRNCRESSNKNNLIWADSLEQTLPQAVYQQAVALVEGQKPSWREIFYQLNTRKTFIFGENSLPDKDFKELPNHHINIKIVSQAGHCMAWENPLGLAKAIKNGLKREKVC